MYSGCPRGCGLEGSGDTDAMRRIHVRRRGPRGVNDAVDGEHRRKFQCAGGFKSGTTAGPGAG